MDEQGGRGVWHNLAFDHLGLILVGIMTRLQILLYGVRIPSDARDFSFL
jgi:hypothetical protein